MATHDIPRETWQDYFNQFSKTHQGAAVTIETVDASADPRIEAKNQSLISIALEIKGSGAGTIAIVLGSETEKHLTYMITAPKHVYHKTGAGIISDEVNPGEILEITADSHPAITQIQFRPR